MTKFKLMTTTAATIIALFTANASMAGQYDITLEKSNTGYEATAEFSDFQLGVSNVSMLSFGAKFDGNEVINLNAGLALTRGDNFSFSLEASHGPEKEELAFEFLVSATELESTYGLLNIGFGLKDDVFTGSLSLADGKFWGFEDGNVIATMSTSDEAANAKLGLTGKTRYGLSLDAEANIDFKDPEKSTVSVSINGEF